MGNKESKGKGGGGGSGGGGKGGKEEKAPSTIAASPAATPAAAPAAAAAAPAAAAGGSSGSSTNVAAANASGGSGGGGDDDDWGDPCVYSKDKAVGVADFTLLTVIGKGSFGKVMQVRKNDDGKIYAMKVLRKDAIIARKQVAHTKAEKSILQKIQHPFIVNLNYAFQTEDKLYMVLDYVNGGELFFHLKKEGKFSEERVRLYAAEISSALIHLHSFGIVYRDLKPENILLDAQGHICITDFGLSKEIKPEEGTNTFCGTPEYLAPEVLKGQGHGCAVDWWSLGTLIFEMLTGLPPFYSQNINIMYQKILHSELRFPSHISAQAQSLLEGLLNRDPDQRLQGEAVKSHPFFSSIDWTDLDAKKIEPVFKPPVKSADDTTQIDTYFTQEAAIDSVVESSAINTAECGFEGFTYVGDNALHA